MLGTHIAEIPRQVLKCASNRAIFIFVVLCYVTLCKDRVPKSSVSGNSTIVLFVRGSDCWLFFMLEQKFSGINTGI